MSKKDTSITIRIDCKTKEKLKEIAKNKALTMSDLVNKCLADVVLRGKEKQIEQIERINLCDEKLRKLKEKMKW